MKIAASDDVAEWFRDEHLAYEALEGSPFPPRLVGWDDDGGSPLLAIEDLSDARWPPPWDRAAVEAVVAALDELHATKPRRALPAAEDRQFGPDSWPDVIADPMPFLSTGVCGRTVARTASLHARGGFREGDDRGLQIAQSRAALPWAALLLGLPPPVEGASRCADRAAA